MGAHDANRSSFWPVAEHWTVGYTRPHEPEPGVQTIYQAFDRRRMMGDIELLLRAEVRAFVAQDKDDVKEAEGRCGTPASRRAERTIGHGLGLLHDFQTYNSTVGTDNGIVDWWLVLFPGGVDWRAIDEGSVYFMVGPVLEERQPGSYLRVMEAISRSLRHIVKADAFDPAAWASRLASLSAADAAREFNFAVVRGLCGEWGMRKSHPRRLSGAAQREINTSLRHYFPTWRPLSRPAQAGSR
jgi:hypothetical protein